MKRLMLTSLAVFFAHMLMAQVANFVVFSPEGQPFYLYLDGKLQNSKPGKNIKVRYTPEGSYTVKAVLFGNGEKTATSTIMIPAKKELSYIVEHDKARGFVFSHYSEVPINQTNTVTSSQQAVEYTNKGRTKSGEVATSTTGTTTTADPSNTNSDGVYTGGDLTSKREGQIKMVTYVAPDGTTRKVTQEEAKRLMAEANKTTASTKEPETGTTEVRAYKEEVHADGSVSIIEEVTTITKVIVNRNGQNVLKTKKQTLQYPTKFKCLPMAKDLHQVLEMKITNAPNNERLDIARAGVKDQCLTSHQVKILGNLIAEGQERNDFAIFAKDFCADPKNYPYKVDDPVIVAKVDDPKTLNNDNNNENTTTTTTNTVSEPEPIEPEKELTAKEMKIKMKAELKLKKLKEKEAKKAAKLAAKEAKKKAKEAAKAAKLEAKKK